MKTHRPSGHYEHFTNIAFSVNSHALAYMATYVVYDMLVCALHALYWANEKAA